MAPMPSIETLVAFFGVSVLLALTPGPDNIFVLLQSAQRGWRAGMCVVLGLCLGLVGHTAAVALGLAAVLATLLATACMVSATWVSLESAAYAIVCWPAVIHGAMGLMVIGAAGRHQGESRRPTDTGADVRSERDQTLRRFDGDVAMEYQRITARLHALGL